MSNIFKSEIAPKGIDFKIDETNLYSIEVKNTNTGRTYNVNVTHYGSVDVHEKRDGGGLPLGLLWIAAIIGALIYGVIDYFIPGSQDM